jgi:hypothetical protein
MGRLHLTQAHVQALLPLLMYFAKTGRLPDFDTLAEAAAAALDSEEPENEQE